MKSTPGYKKCLSQKIEVKMCCFYGVAVETIEGYKLVTNNKTGKSFAGPQSGFSRRKVRIKLLV
jgi:hypothetical protein